MTAVFSDDYKIEFKSIIFRLRRILISTKSGARRLFGLAQNKIIFSEKIDDIEIKLDACLGYIKITFVVNAIEHEVFHVHNSDQWFNSAKKILLNRSIHTADMEPLPANTVKWEMLDFLFDYDFIELV